MEKIHRPAPDADRRDIRHKNLLAQSEHKIDKGNLPSPGFEPGNKKTGRNSRTFEEVIVWNLPAYDTCPGRSDWCTSVCYNGDDRPDVFEKDKWFSNLLEFQENQVRLMETLQGELDMCESPTAVRIHSSGDFFSEEYTRFWTQIVDNNPSVTFWAYTRSWVNENLMGALEELRSRQNIQLFASWDETMVQPPQGWRISYVKDGSTSVDFPQNLTRCPEEFLEGMNCARCGFCLRNIGRGVLFNAH